jgi:Glycosyl hydrolase 36 superfamily, catalytic domain/Glycosyltransferase family 36
MGPDTDREGLLRSAGLHQHTLIDRLRRGQFRKRPKRVGSFAAQAQDVDNPHTFQITDEGNGIFGYWIVDKDGLPAYEYRFDHLSNSRADYPTSDSREHRDHWHQVGNKRITALASNDGVVQVYMADRGGTFLNRFEAWESEGTVNSILAFLASIALIIVRFLAWLKRPPSNTPQPFAVESVTGEDISYHPRNMTSLKSLREVSNLNTKPDPLSVSTQTVFPSEPDTIRPDTAAQSQIVTAPPNHAYSGGFGYLDDGTEVWSTAYRYRPRGTQPTRSYGMGYFETQMDYRNIQVTRRLTAPIGNDPLVVVEIQIENLGEAAADVSHFEYWDVNVHQLSLQWLRTGAFGAASDSERRELNKKFTQSMTFEADKKALVYRQIPPPDAPPADAPSTINWYPAPIFLADLNSRPDAYYVNRDAFFGSGGAKQPQALTSRLASTPDPDASSLMPYCMVMKRRLHIAPHQSETLRYAFGAADDLDALLLRYQTENIDVTANGWKSQLAYFWTGQDATLQREVAWHAYNLLSATTYSAFHDVHVVPQGSAYLFLHGADGVPRDQSLFSIPTTYLDPNLAKDMLRLIMRLTDGRTGQIPYAFAGHGYVSNALNVHTEPSDLDLFFLLAVCEYLSATGDMDFLGEHVPFYPPGEGIAAPGDTVLDHIRFAVSHLFGVLMGESGLLRVGSGDWSDSIVLQSLQTNGLLGLAAYQNSKVHGESVPNSQMALYVLPLLAKVLQNQAADVTALIQDGRLGRLQTAVESQWNADLGCYNRAVLRDGVNQVAPLKRFDLEGQVWAIISRVAQANGHETSLIDRIEETLDRPSPIGALLMPVKPNKMVWPAISQLLTWAYMRAGRSDLAWRSLNRNTFAAHAHEYPAIWYGIWSGPDGIYSLEGNNISAPGHTWVSEMTPMTDFPVMNTNQDGMALLSLLRVCGIEPAPTGDGLVIKPMIPRERFVLDFPLIYLKVEPGKIQGKYRAKTHGSINLHLYPPGSDSPTTIQLTFEKGQELAFESS